VPLLSLVNFINNSSEICLTMMCTENFLSCGGWYAAKLCSYCIKGRAK
jgi:hypothetical protein